LKKLPLLPLLLRADASGESQGGEEEGGDGR